MTPDRLFAAPDAAARVLKLAGHELETFRAGLYARVQQRQARDAVEADWVARRVAKFEHQLAASRAHMEKISTVAGDAADRRKQALRERMAEIETQLSELAEFMQALKEGRTFARPDPEPPPVTIWRLGLMDDIEAARVTEDFRAPQTGWTFDQIYAVADRHQGTLNRAGADIARELGMKFKPVEKKARAAAEAKMTRKGYADTNRLTDIVRAGFDAPTSEAAEAIVQALARRFDVLDEGWKVTDAGYLDRKVLVRFPDGLQGEIQIWPPGILAAKEGKGHAIYQDWRDLAGDRSPEAEAKKAELLQAQRVLYDQTMVAAGGEWPIFYRDLMASGSGGKGGKAPNLEAKAAAETTRPELSATSPGSHSTQSAPGASITSALPSNISAAGLPSQSIQVLTDIVGSSAANVGKPGTPRNLRAFDEAGGPARRTARMEGRLRERLDVLRRHIAAVTRDARAGDRKRFGAWLERWNEREAELAGFIDTMDKRAAARQAWTDAELGDEAARVETILEDTRRRAELALRRFIADEQRFAVIETDPVVRRMMFQGTRPGTVYGEAARFIMDLKGFPIAFTQRALGRAALGYADEAPAQRRGCPAAPLSPP